MDGTLDIWDIIFKQTDPSLSIQVTDDPLYITRIHDNGRFIVTGSQYDITTLIDLSDNVFILWVCTVKPTVTDVKATNELKSRSLSFALVVNEKKRVDKTNIDLQASMSSSSQGSFSSNKKQRFKTLLLKTVEAFLLSVAFF